MTREKLIEELKKKFVIGEKWHDIDLDELADFIIAERKRIVESLVDYTSHEEECLCSQWRQGRPTKDGGYETMYGYGSSEKWYQRGEEPECTCGLNETIKNAMIEE